MAAPSIAEVANPPVGYHWVLEHRTIRIRWVVATLCLGLIPLYPQAPALEISLLALILGVGNACIILLVRRERHQSRLKLIRALATALEWAVALGVTLISTHDALNSVPAILISLPLLSRMRYGRIGLIAAFISGDRCVGAAIAEQAVVLRTLDPPAVFPLLFRSSSFDPARMPREVR